MVAIQDLAPQEEPERMRAEFLGMVSHELRTPLRSDKDSAFAVLGASRVLDPPEMLQFFRVIDEQADQTLDLLADLLDRGRIETGTLSVSPEPTDAARHAPESSPIRVAAAPCLCWPWRGVRSAPKAGSPDQDPIP